MMILAMLLCVVRQAHHEGGWLTAGNYLATVSPSFGRLVVILQPTVLPHGELVEPRIAAKANRKN
ncbi:hypothetical protein C7476_103254 [Phyllobacterium bourgognense]|uniref:Uncharacterized protein n=1 Tax=Phyllobacterium bourgognense TaxID=314236 RepID=A0A368YZ05_9HYPH|nr:hypothetical protein C7476_103254 [Phyllobacterium bourgognense]